MKLKNTILIIICALVFPMGALALNAPTVGSVPSQINADVYTLTINVPIGSKVNVIGGPNDLAPMTDGAGSDALDGIVKFMVGLAQEKTNIFSITAEREGEFSNSVTVTIKETNKATSTEKGDTTSPTAPEIDDISNPVKAYEYEITGSTEASANIYVEKGGNKVASTQANSNGLFHIIVDLETGKTNRFNISAEDGAGNKGAATQAVIQAIQPDYPRPEGEDSYSRNDNESIEQPFNDVPKDAWFYTYIEDLVDEGIIDGSKDEYNPAELVNRAELSKMIVEAFDFDLVTPNIPTFKDVPKDAWFYSYVETVAANGITAGYKDSEGNLTGYFGPGDSVTREQAAKLIVLGAQFTINTINGSSFSDVPENRWSYDYVETVYANGIVSGYQDATFRPGNNINRAEIAKLVSGAMSK